MVKRNRCRTPCATESDACVGVAGVLSFSKSSPSLTDTGGAVYCFNHVAMTRLFCTVACSSCRQPQCVAEISVCRSSYPQALLAPRADCIKHPECAMVTRALPYMSRDENTNSICVRSLSRDQCDFGCRYPAVKYLCATA